MEAFLRSIPGAHWSFEMDKFESWKSIVLKTMGVGLLGALETAHCPRQRETTFSPLP